MNKEDLEDLLSEVLSEVAPNFYLEEDDNGQLIICTNLACDEDGDLMELELDEDEDLDFDPDAEPLEEEDDDD